MVLNVDVNCTFSIFFYQGGVQLLISDEDNDEDDNDDDDDEECRQSHQSKSPKRPKHTNMVAIHRTRSHSNDFFEPNGTHGLF